MSMSKTKSTEIANCLLLSVFAYFCGLCAYFEGFLRKFVCGLHNLGINTLQFLPYDGKSCSGGAGEQEQCILCVWTFVDHLNRCTVKPLIAADGSCFPSHANEAMGFSRKGVWTHTLVPAYIIYSPAPGRI